MRKRLAACVAALLCLWCAGCSGTKPVLPAPNASIILTYQQSHGHANHCYLDVEITDVLDGVYHREDWLDTADYLIAVGRVKKVFRTLPAYPFEERESIPIWITLQTVTPEQYDPFRRVLERADSLIVYGVPEYTEAAKDAVFPEGYAQLALPDTVRVRIYYLNGWDIIPIVNGVADGSGMEAVMRSSNQSMNYPLDMDRPGNIVSGDTVSEIYAFLEEHCKEQS